MTNEAEKSIIVKGKTSDEAYDLLGRTHIPLGYEVVGGDSHQTDDGWEIVLYLGLDPDH